ncbi:large ribosomal subunit protein eL43-like [Desmodus rotundus]|uniref:large ribosomal subunit protein eL43-like n=1 Tax=Desmodus rotundus TaxID=9430 RepID=UPI0039E3B976
MEIAKLSDTELKTPAIMMPKDLIGETTKRTKKVRIVGKESTHYGTALRKTVKKTEISHHTKYTCSFCGKTKMKRRAVGTWHCGSCVKMAAGGAWTHSPTSAVMATSAIRRLKGPKDQEELHSLTHC